jgi:hypothetical protein
MHLRLTRRLEATRLDLEGRERVLDANARALAHRLSVLRDEDHYDALHPSRTLLILLDDCDVTDAAMLHDAALVESEHEALRLPGDESTAVPTPRTSGDELTEQLVSAPEAIRLIALAERLDHARHLHLRERAAWPDFHESIATIYAPIADRTHPRLAARYARWLETFPRRFRDPRRTG